MKKIVVFLMLLTVCGCSSLSNNRTGKGSGLDKYIESPCACILEIGSINMKALG